MAKSVKLGGNNVIISRVRRHLIPSILTTNGTASVALNLKVYTLTAKPFSTQFSHSFFIFKKLTYRHVRILNSECPDLTGSELLVSGIDGIAILSGNKCQIDAQILVR